MNTHYTTTPLIHEKDRPALEERPIEKPPVLRIFWIVGSLLRIFARYFKSKFSRKITPQARALELRQFLETMGGLWIKVGQVLAMRTDLFPVEFCNELSRLQDRSITFSAQRSKEIIETELRAPIDDVFDEFEEAPFAAASLSQVHRARLRSSGARVAVKVQRPYAYAYFSYDFRWLKLFAKFLNVLHVMQNLRLDRMLIEVHEMMEEELDYRMEASNMRRLRVILKAHRIIVPVAYRNLSTGRILVMDYLEGVFMSDLINVSRSDPNRAENWLADNDIETRIVARRLFQSVMRQLYEDLFFHADLHPGNIMLLKGNRLAFIDFGNCGKVDQKFAAQYEQYFRAMSEHALDRAADLLLLTLGKLPAMDVDAFKKRVIRVLEKQISRSFVTNLPYREKSIGANSAELSQIMAEFNIEVNWEMLKMARAFESVDQNISVLNPKFNFTTELQRYQARARTRRKQLQLQNLPNILDQLADFSQIILPSMMQRSLTLGGSVGKGIQIVTAIFSLFRKALFVGIVAFVWMYLYQHHHSVVDQFHDEESDLLTDVGVGELVEHAPKLDPEVWIGGAVILLIFIYQLRKFSRKLLQTDPPRPRN